MTDRKILERRLSNRSSKNELFSRGIIQSIEMDQNVALQLNKLKKQQAQSTIQENILHRPSKQELVNIGILDGQDFEKTQMVKKFISEHLANRPGPLDVYVHLVSNEGNSDNIEDCDSIGKVSFAKPYHKAKSMLLTKYAHNNNDGANNVQPRNGTRRGENSRNVFGQKYKNITFHEFVPGKRGSNGHFVRCDIEKNITRKNQSNAHYIRLVDQQAKFLQLELNRLQSIDITKNSFNWDNIDLKPNNGYEYQSCIPETPPNLNDEIKLEFENINIDFTSSDMKMLDQLRNQYASMDCDSPGKDDQSYDIINFNESYYSVEKNMDALSDIVSSGYGTSLPICDEAGIYEKQYLGFGMYNDCEGFNSVYEKIEMYERLQSSKNNGFIRQ